MQTSIISEEKIRNRKMGILICGVILYFLTSMSKVLIPATIFNELQQAGLDVKSISAMGAVYMYSYAASQLLAGIFSDRYGGVRFLLIGGSLFTLGTLGFPFTDNLYLMYLSRILTGFGAGTVFLGVAKLLSDLFSARFAAALGFVLVLGFFGPTAGTMMIHLINLLGWKWAMAVPGLISAVGMLVILAVMKGTVKPVTKGQTLTPLFMILKKYRVWFLWLTSSVIFGSYYVLLGQIGQKSIIDFCKIRPEKAALAIMLMTIMVAVNNMGVNGMLKLCGNRRKTVAIFGITCTLLGSVLGWAAFTYNLGLTGILPAFYLVAFPAGFFPLYSQIAKEMFSAEYTGLAVAMVNFMAFVFIAAFQNISGRILEHFTTPLVKLSGIFPASAYAAIFLFFCIAALPAVIAAFFIPETKSQDDRS